MPEIHLPPMREPRTASWFVYVIRLADRFTRDDRDAVMKHLQNNGVGCNPYFVPIHLQPYVRELMGTREGDFPHTERLAARTIALPFFAKLSEQQVQRVKSVLKEALWAVGSRR
jgi:perosamine synthetase